MKKTIKIFCAALSLAMLLPLAACGGGKVKTLKSGTLIMATNAQFPPYEYYEGGKITGIDAEIAQAIADKLGLKLEIDDMEFGAIITAVSGGKADLGLAGMTVKPEREEAVNFTVSYATGVQVIIVKENSVIKSVDDLFADDANYRIGVQMATTGDIYTTDDLEAEGKAFIDRYSKGAEAVMALVTDKVDCVVIDNEPAKGNTALFEKVNAALKELIEDGTVQRIIDKYIKAE